MVLFSIIVLSLNHCTGVAVFSSSSTFGPGNGPVFLSNLQCTGSELELLECSHTIFVGTYCNHQRDVGLRCEGGCHITVEKQYTLNEYIVVISEFKNLGIKHKLDLYSTLQQCQTFNCIIRTVVRIVGMGRMSHICNTKCSRL